jgi:F420-dependent oxidoreductase-like protein
MRLSLMVLNYTWPGGPSQMGDEFSLIGERAEGAGLYSLWVPDHFVQFGPDMRVSDNEMLEGWSALAFAAGRTRHIRLGTLVTGVTHRHPSVLVKTATTLDVLSGGRTYFGVGAAWSEEEHRALGIPFPPLSERFERLEETVQIAVRMWAGDERPYRGKHYHLERPVNSPPALQKPHPPILIGGGGERKTLRLVARHAQACNLTDDLGSLGHKLDVLRRHCEAVGRPYEEIEKTSFSRLHLTRNGGEGSLTPQAAVEHFGALAELGIDHAIFSLRNVYEREPFELLAAEVLPKLGKISVAGR